MLETKEEIEQWLDKYSVENYTINEDLTVDVAGSLYLERKGLTEIPVQFGIVTGEFDCSRNSLSSLKGAPHTVFDDYNCSRNSLTSLEGSPKCIDGYFDCSFNQITSLKGAPESVSKYFLCVANKLTTLEGAPHVVVRDFFCFGNNLSSLGNIETSIGRRFKSSPLPEFAALAQVDSDGDYIVTAEDFNAKVQELKRIREEKALFESSIAKVLDTPPLGEPTNQAAEPQLQQRAKPKFKL